MHRDCAVAVLSDSPRGATHRHACDKTLFAPMLAKRGPSSHPGDGALLYWPRRLYNFHPGFSHFHCPTGLSILSKGMRRYPSMAIPDCHFARIDRRIRRDQVSGKCELELATSRPDEQLH